MEGADKELKAIYKELIRNMRRPPEISTQAINVQRFDGLEPDSEEISDQFARDLEALSRSPSGLCAVNLHHGAGGPVADDQCHSR